MNLINCQKISRFYWGFNFKLMLKRYATFHDRCF